MTIAPLFFDVTDPVFGADPTGQADSTAAFQAALDAAGEYKTVLQQEHLCPNIALVRPEVPKPWPWPPQTPNTGTPTALAFSSGVQNVSAVRPDRSEPRGTSPPSAALEASKAPNVVVVPPGAYWIGGPLVVPPFVTLQGSWTRPPDPGAAFNFPSPRWISSEPPYQTLRPWWDPNEYLPHLHGSVLLTDYGRGCEDAGDKYAFITLVGPSSTLKGFWIYYPWQGVLNRRGGRKRFGVVPYQWTIRAAPLPGQLPGNHEGISCAVSEVLLLNSYSGLDFTYYSGRHILQHIWGQPIREGIRIDNAYDIGRILDIHFWPFWDHGGAEKGPGMFIRDFTARYGFALVLFRSDMQIVHNFFAIGYFVGVHLGFSSKSGEGRPGGACSAQFTNLNLDQMVNAIDYHATAQNGVQITNANLVCMQPGRVADLARHAIVAHHYTGHPKDGFDHPREGFLALRGAGVFGASEGPMVSWQSEQMLMISSTWFRNDIQEQEAQIQRKFWLESPIIELGHGRAIIQGNWFANGPRTHWDNPVKLERATDTIRASTSVSAAVITGNMSESGVFSLGTTVGPPHFEVANNIVIG
jgi:hypothetical protein